MIEGTIIFIQENVLLKNVVCDMMDMLFSLKVNP